MNTSDRLNDDSPLIYEFAGRRVDPVRRQLTHAGHAVALFPRCFDALLLLIERRGELLEKEFLMEALWPDVVVEENSLAKLISDVRRALGEGPKDQGCIMTVPRRGYRFTAQVTIRRSTESAPVANAATTSQMRTLAVLPFGILNPAAGDEFLGLGLADALITRLGLLRHTVLRPTSSIARFAVAGFPPADAGRQLGVDCVITGSLRRAGQVVRVTVQLISVSGDTVAWAEKFDSDSVDSLALEDSIAERVADALTLALARGDSPPAPRRYTNDPVAYEHFIHGRYLWTKRTRESLLLAVQCFERAIAIDPRYALAYSSMGDCWILLGLRAAVSQSLRPRETMPKARAAAERALAIDPSLAAAHATLGQVLFIYEWQREAGLLHLRRALELEPNNANANHWYAMALAGLGRFDAALLQIRRAREIDPLSVLVSANVGFILYRAGRHDEAIAQLRRAAQMEPDSPMVRYRLGLAYGGLGLHEEALAEFSAMHPSPTDPVGFTGIARSLALLGRRAEALQLLEQIKEYARAEYFPSAWIADVYVALGDFDRAFELLDQAVEERTIVLLWLAYDRNWDPLRADPRFPAILARIGL
jgi:DNA-binding winged helix-turn-helix (wHTH) protein/tetratricopeptide (TPR) repeat protein